MKILSALIPVIALSVASISALADEPAAPMDARALYQCEASGVAPGGHNYSAWGYAYGNRAQAEQSAIDRCEGALIGMICRVDHCQQVSQ